MKEEKIKGYIGQLHSIQESLENNLDEEEFREVCDCIAILKTHLCVTSKRYKDKDKLVQLPIEEFEDGWNDNHAPVFVPLRGFDYAHKVGKNWQSNIDGKLISPSHFYKPLGNEIEI